MVHVYPNLSDQNFNSIKGNYLWHVVPFMAFSIEYLLKFEFNYNLANLWLSYKLTLVSFCIYWKWTICRVLSILLFNMQLAYIPPIFPFSSRLDIYEQGHYEVCYWLSTETCGVGKVHRMWGGIVINIG